MVRKSGKHCEDSNTTHAVAVALASKNRVQEGIGMTQLTAPILAIASSMTRAGDWHRRADVSL